MGSRRRVGRAGLLGAVVAGTILGCGSPVSPRVADQGGAPTGSAGTTATGGNGASDAGADAAAPTAGATGKAGTTDGLPSDPAHSFGCFSLGHAGYVQATGTSAAAPLAG